MLRIEPAAWESPKLGTCSSTNNGREPQNFKYPSIKSCNNPGNIPLKLCKCSQIPHSSPRVASTSNRTKTNHYWLSTYKHFTRTKLRKPACEKTEGKLPNLWDNREILDSSLSLKQKKQKDKNWRFPQGARWSKPDQERFRVLYPQHQGWWSTNRILSKTSSVYLSFGCQLSNCHHKQCIKYNNVYINELEKYTWNYTSSKVFNMEKFFFTTAKKSKFTNSLAASEMRHYW